MQMSTMSRSVAREVVEVVDDGPDADLATVAARPASMSQIASTLARELKVGFDVDDRRFPGRLLRTLAGRHGAGSGGRFPAIRSAFAWAVRASSMALKQWACGMAVSVRFRTSSRQLARRRQIGAGAIDVARALAVDEEQVVAAGPAGDVDVFPELDVALGADDE